MLDAPSDRDYLEQFADKRNEREEFEMQQLVDGIEIDYSGLPERYRETMRLWIEGGRKPGSGFTAILANSLRAIVIVDSATLEALPRIYHWLMSYAPEGSWGSHANVADWQAARRADRKAASDACAF